LVLHLAAWNPNTYEGGGQSLLSEGFIGTWKNLGSGVADAIQASGNQPQWKAYGSNFAVQFDGVSNLLEMASSASTLKFIHETAIFDIFVAARGGTSKNSVIIGNAYTTSEKGFIVERTGTAAGGYLTFWLWLGGAFRAFQTSSYLSPIPSFEIGTANKVLFRGNGTNLQGSANLSTITNGPSLPALPVGDATYACQIGAMNGQYFYGGDILDIAIYNRNLSAGELTTMSDYYSERYGL
jgi:hypothetical protein